MSLVPENIFNPKLQGLRHPEPAAVKEVDKKRAGVWLRVDDRRTESPDLFLGRGDRSCLGFFARMPSISPSGFPRTSL